MSVPRSATTGADGYRITYLTGQLQRGGSEHQLYLTLAHLDRSGLDCSVVSFEPRCEPELRTAIEGLGVPVTTLPPGCAGIRRRVAFVRRLLRRTRPDIVHSWTFHLNPYAGLVARGLGVRGRIGSLRGSLAARRTDLSWLLRRLSVTSTAYLTVNSAAAREEVVRFGLAAARVVEVPNSLPPELLRDEAPPPADLSDLGIGPDLPVVGMVANLRRIKNYPMFVRALGVVCRERPDVRGLIVGQESSAEPQLPGELDTLVRREGLAGKVLRAGARRDVPALFSRFDVACLTSWHEGTPNSVLEAMAMGCPVVATAVGGLGAVIEEGRNGLLVPPNDHEELARAILGLLDRPERRAALGAAGRERVRAVHRPEYAARRFEELYRTCLARRGRPAERVQQDHP